MTKEILEITKNFHDTYEKLASEYAYKTREDTKVFDINSNNGKLMYATVNEIVSPILKENQELKDNWNELKKYIQDICCYDEVGLRIIDPSYLEDKIAELERGVSDEN